MAQTTGQQRKTVGRDGVELRYEVIGPEGGPAIVVTPGGQNGVDFTDYRDLAHRLAQTYGFRVLLHDRVNNGGSSIFLGRDRSKAETEAELESAEYRGHGEPQMQAYFLRLLMKDLDMLPAFLWGNSSGARMSIFFASMFPSDVRGLCLVNITAGRIAGQCLAQAYHSIHAEACRRGGMRAVMQQELFSNLIRLRPANADILKQMDPADFIAVEDSWASFLAAREGNPIVGATNEVLASVRQPAFCVNNYGESHDDMHTPAAIRALAAGLGNCQECMVETNIRVWLPRALAFMQSVVQEGSGR